MPIPERLGLGLFVLLFRYYQTKT